jgi:hypothetical protein
MRKLLVLAILTSSLTFAQGVKETLKESKEQLEKTKEIVKDGTETVSKAKSSALNVYGDLKDGTALVYDDLKSLGIEGKEAMKDVVTIVKQASIKTWDLLVKQQLVWSWCCLAVTLSSILMFFRTLKQYNKMQNDKSETGGLKETNVILTAIFIFSTITLFIISTLHFEQMLTGFINPEFGALRTLIELGQKIK